MRKAPILLIMTNLASCIAVPHQPTRSADKQHEFQRLLEGKVAQAPIGCLPHYRSNDMRVIDDETIAFRDGNHRTYVAHMEGGCSNLGAGNYALVTRQYGSPDLCHGDIAQVVDTLSRSTVGSCTFGEFVPYVTPGT